MILTQQDLDEFAAEYEAFGNGYAEGNPDSKPTRFWSPIRRFYWWLAQNPQVVVAAGYQEFLGAHSIPSFEVLGRYAGLMTGERPAFRSFSGSWLLPSDINPDPEKPWDAYSVQELQALRAHDLKGKIEEQIREHPSSNPDRAFEDIVNECLVPMPSFAEILKEAQGYVDNPMVDPTAFVSPALWTPEEQEKEKNALTKASLQIIRAIQEEQMELSELHWRQLEDIVAEVFRAQGLEIHKARSTPQGGRDVIARGPLLPGYDPLTIAVEVKHRDVVDRPEVQKAIFQNRRFPALHILTSGRFSSGAIQEAKAPENRLRLFLHDGVAIRNLIRSYPGISGITTP